MIALIKGLFHNQVLCMYNLKVYKSIYYEKINSNIVNGKFIYCHELQTNGSSRNLIDL